MKAICFPYMSRDMSRDVACMPIYLWNIHTTTCISLEAYCDYYDNGSTKRTP